MYPHLVQAFKPVPTSHTHSIFSKVFLILSLLSVCIVESVTVFPCLSFKENVLFDSVSMYFILYCVYQSQDSSVGIVTVWRLVFDSRQGPGFFSFAQCPDRFWGRPNLLSNGYWLLFPRGYSGRGVKLTAYPRLASRWRMVELYRHSPIRLHGIMLN
jgi:hypothetical protein